MAKFSKALQFPQPPALEPKGFERSLPINHGGRFLRSRLLMSLLMQTQTAE
jgi:hypothetical protein